MRRSYQAEDEMNIEQDEGQMSDREAMKLALEALKASHPISNTDKSLDKHSEAMFALRQALEQKPWDTTDMAHRAGGLSMGQEPVTWRNAAIRLGEDLYSVGPNGYYDMTASQWLDWALSVVNTAPPKREWVGLTDEEIFDVIRSLCADNETAEMLIHVSMDEYRAIEAKLKEKNK